jgi:hypothetical protein
VSKLLGQAKGTGLITGAQIKECLKAAQAEDADLEL